MKLFFLFALILVSSCSNNSNGKSSTKDKSTTNDNTTTAIVTSESSNAGKQASLIASKQSDGIIGEWKLMWEANDTNGNGILDDDERKNGKTNTKYYYRFNTDGSCLIHTTRTKGHYEIKTENNKRKLYVYSDEAGTKGLVDLWVISIVSKDELVLLEGFGELQFWVFKQI